MVACDTLEYRKFFDKKAVKKTLTIPNWLNIMAERAGVNFSAVLQEALLEKLNIH
ncbi:MAG: toxin-antitoxin system, antitoxin component, HicB domain protein [Oscillospiraceae bacterium]|nr:toxin-antitoxin system, antitoxin component, HicB domain protein [Oscillospiraceae bacterium]